MNNFKMLAIAIVGSCFGGALPAQQLNTIPMDSDHDAHMASTNELLSAPSEGGQSAFSAIQEIVEILLNDPVTDWVNVDIEALRLHLIDMHNVTIYADIKMEKIEGGAKFHVSSDDPKVARSISNMTMAHTAVADGIMGWQLTSVLTENGAALTAIGDDEVLPALGFIGLMTVGAHHQSHHLAIATGASPH